MHDNLFKNYSATSSPYLGDTPLRIDVGFYFELLIGVNEKDHIVTSMIWHVFYWNDTRLEWKPQEYHGIKQLHIPAHKIWKPDFMLQNSVGDELYFSDLDSTSLVLIRYNGFIQWSPVHKAQTSCPLDTSFYPFDTQICHFWITSWTYDSSVIEPRNITIPTYAINPNSTEWELVDVSSSLDALFSMSYDENLYLSIRHSVKLGRHMTFFSLSLIVPCIIHAFLPFLMFLLPADNGDRMAVGTNVSAAQIVFLLIITETIPGRSSGKMPVLGMANILVMILVTISLVLTSMASNCRHLHDCPQIVQYLYGKLFKHDKTRNLFQHSDDMTSHDERFFVKRFERLCLLIQMVALGIGISYLVIDYTH